MQQEHLKKLIATKQRRLQKRQEQQAIMGLSADPMIEMEIEDIEAELKHLYAQLDSLQTSADYVPALPSPPRRFTGRIDLLEDLGDTLTAPQGAIVALQGMGGVGKTAIAQQTAQMLQNHFSGGIFWADLPSTDGNVIPVLQSWGRTMGVALTVEQDTATLAQIIRGLLTDQQTRLGPILIVIDDVRDEWLTSATLLQKTLPPSASLLLTTRNDDLARAMYSNHVLHIETLPATEALALLKKHASDTLVQQEIDTAQKLLKVLGYLPLAVKLAGQWLARFSRKYRQKTIARLLNAIQKQGLDTMSLPGLPGLTATLSITFNGLTSEQQRLFTNLSVFASDLLRAPSVAGVLITNVEETELALDELVNLALLDWGDPAENEVFTYTIHPLLKEYASLILEQGGEKEVPQRAYVDSYLGFAKANNQNSPDAHNQLDTELADLLQATEIATILGEHQAVSDFGLALWEESEFLFIRGYYREVEVLLKNAIETSKTLGGNETKAIHLKNLGTSYRSTGNLTDAETAYLESKIFFDGLLERPQEYLNLCSHPALCFVMQQKYNDAETLYVMSLSRYGVVETAGSSSPGEP